MKSLSMQRPWQFLMAALLIPLLAFVLACGPGEEATPTPTAAPLATPTVAPLATPTAAPLATATPTRPGPAATPTPTSVAVPTSTPSPVKIKRGGLLRSGVVGDPAGFDPMMHAFAPTDPHSNANLYSQLLVNLVGLDLVCDLCTTWGLEDGGKTMVFNLVKNAVFQDGSKLTSKDVVYSLKKMVGQIEGQAISPRCGIIKEYLPKDVAQPFEATDDYTVKIHLAFPSAALPLFMSSNFCVILKEGTKTTDVLKQPNGSGPFRIGKWDLGATMQLVPTPNYWKKDSNGVQLPYLDTLELAVINNTEALMAAAMTGRIDKGGSLTGAGLDTIKLAEEWAKSGKGTLSGADRASVNGGAIINVTKPPFDNIKVRAAINLALDRKSYAAILFNDRAKPALYQSPDSAGARTAAEIWDKIPGWGTGAKKAVEVEQAKQLMKDAGFADGFSAPIYTFTGVWYELSTPEWMVSQLARIGIKVQLKTYESTATFFPVMTAGDFGIAGYIYGYGGPDPDVMLGSYFITGGNRNWSRISDPRIDALYLQQRVELDPQKRNQLVRQAEDILLEQAPWAPVSAFTGGSLLSRNWGGWAEALAGYTGYRYEYSYDTRVQ